MELLKPNGSFNERMFELLRPMTDIALKGQRDREDFKNEAFMEFEDIRKEIQRLKSEEEFLVPKLPLRKTRTKKRTMKSQQSMSNSNELSDKSSVGESSKELSETSDRTSRALRRERSKRPSIGIRSPPTNSSRPSKVRKLNKLQKQAPDSVSLVGINEDQKSDEDLLSNNGTENGGGHEIDKADDQQRNKMAENRGNQIESSKDKKMEAIQNNKMEEIQFNKREETQSINKVEIQVSKTEEVQDNKKDCIKNSKEDANKYDKTEDNQRDNKIEDGHCDISQNMIHFNDDHLFTSTPRPSCLVGKLRRDISDQTTIAPKEQITSNRVRNVKETHPIDVIDGIAKKTIDTKERISTKVMTNVIPDVKSQKKNTKNADKENLGYKTPERIITPNKKLLCSPILSGSVKKRVEAFERAGGKLIECSPRIGVANAINSKGSEKKFENPMRMTRNASKALSHALNNHGSVTKLSSKALQEKTNTMKPQDERENNAYKKKEELMKAAVEERQRRREEKGKKVIAQREAEEKEKMELALKIQKEKEEKFKKLQKERDEKIKEENMKKKLLAAQKAVEMEERRKEDEAARIARLKEIEDEERRKAAQKIRTETEKIRLKKLEEQRIQQAEKEREKEKLKVVASKQNGKKLKENKDPEDYGADDMNAEDSTDDEDKPKREVPIWAEKKNRKLALLKQSHIPDSLIHKWFHKKNDKRPNLASLFTGRIHTRPRTSSVLWDSRVCFDNSTTQFS